MNNQKRQRFAVYARYSSEMQNEISIEAQLDRCQKAVAQRGGVIVATYSDMERTGWSLERDGFNDMRRAAERGKFDAVMFWKFDRLARDHNHTVMIKMLLRHEYGLKLFCVEGSSEDDDNSPYAAMQEQMLAVFAAFYSKNLSSETKRGKRQRAINGDFNGSVPPLGYSLVIQYDPEREARREKKGRVLPPNVLFSTRSLPPGLYVDPRAAALVRRAFRMYATGKYSDSLIARWLMERPYIQRLRAGIKPLDKETIRDMLQNRLYTGRVRYTDTVYKGTLGERRTSKRNRSEWFEGRHAAIIDDALFEACQEARKGLLKARHSPSTERAYILHDRVYCAQCTQNMPAGLMDENYGKMRPKWDYRGQVAYYYCTSGHRGYTPCGSPRIEAGYLDASVAFVIANMQIPEGFRDRIEAAIRSRVENEAALQRMDEIRQMVERIDFSWEQGFYSKEEYAEKRARLREEMDALRPIEYDDLIEAATLLNSFTEIWQAAEAGENTAKTRRQLLQRIVNRVFVADGELARVVIHENYSIALNENAQRIVDGVRSWNFEFPNGNFSYGDDGSRTRDLCLDRAVC